MKTISIIIPVYMEAKNIRAAVENTLWALREAKIVDYEIMIIDCKRLNGTDDGTPAIADDLAQENNKIKVFHNQYVEFGAKYWMGVDAARFPYITMVPGDNELARETLRDMLFSLGEADIITTYAVNSHIRPLARRIISRLFTFLVNASAGLNMRYYNGACIHRTDILKQVKDRNISFAYMAKLLVKLIKAGCSFKEVPVTLQKRTGGKSAAFKINNIINVCRALSELFWEYRIAGTRDPMVLKGAGNE